MCPVNAKQEWVLARLAGGCLSAAWISAADNTGMDQINTGVRAGAMTAPEMDAALTQFRSLGCHGPASPAVIDDPEVNG